MALSLTLSSTKDVDRVEEISVVKISSTNILDLSIGNDVGYDLGNGANPLVVVVVVEEIETSVVDIGVTGGVNGSVGVDGNYCSDVDLSIGIDFENSEGVASREESR